MISILHYGKLHKESDYTITIAVDYTITIAVRNSYRVGTV